VTRKSIALSVAAAATALATGGLTLSSSAAAGAKLHTRHYDAKTVSVSRLDPKDTVSSVDLSSRHLASAGKLKGSAVFTCHINRTGSDTEHCKGAIALRRGVLFATARVPFSTQLLSGRITGGSGVFRGAQGNFKAVGESGRHSIMTITYKN
jgi:hypothetical protein